MRDIAKRKVIIVTDGDLVAKSAVEIATNKIGGRCISLSAGNPTLLTGDEILELIRIAKHDPVVIMVDDRGDKGEGKGERALEQIMKSDDIEVLGVVAVASNGKDKCGMKVSFSIDKNGNKLDTAVDKYGNQVDIKEISGDTLSVLKRFKSRIPLIIGIGDPGKMDRKDDIALGAPITTLALQEIMKLQKNSAQT